LSAVQTSDFDYTLPHELIAQVPELRRDQSRLLVVDRGAKIISHRHFYDLPSCLKAGDVLVLNNSKVIPARLRARNRETGGKFEVLLLEEVANNDWWAMMKPGKRARRGTSLEVQDRAGNSSGFAAIVRDLNEEGHRRLLFSGRGDILEALEELGEMPLPPYIVRKEQNLSDSEQYQTIYAQAPGSVAAPTAGLHFTTDLLANVREKGVKVCFVTLHVGLGTFSPIKSDDLGGHVMHYESYEIPAETAGAIREAKKSGRRVIAVGTTTMRVLESGSAAGRGRTNLFIRPPYQFKVVDALVTNFHLPRSTLLVLVSAFAAPGSEEGRELILRAYREAIAERYRFFSYGDAMLIV
jgi:S-adenosylmethionine:tRNA ribosyltransferase-isomerase